MYQIDLSKKETISVSNASAHLGNNTLRNQQISNFSANVIVVDVVRLQVSPASHVTNQ